MLWYLNGDMVPPAEANVSILDSGFMMGDGVWEGMRMYNGYWSFVDQHIARLFEGAKTIDMDLGMTPAQLEGELNKVIDANNLQSAEGVHIRLMCTRGVKTTPYQSPKVNITGPTIAITVEFKDPPKDSETHGLRLATVSTRRGHPDVQDQKLNSHSKLNCISACIQAAKAGADEALMLNPHGMVATCNSTHFFIVRGGEVWTSSGNYCIPGITRGNIIKLCKENNIPVFEKDFSLYDVYGADECFVTGTYAGVSPVSTVDGRTIAPLNWNGDKEPEDMGEITALLRSQYKDFAKRDAIKQRARYQASLK